MVVASAVEPLFQPALPMRGVTAQLLGGDGRLVISTRTPHAGSDHGLEQRDLLLRISTRTPHAGSDQRQLLPEQIRSISTRTPHAGSD